MRRARRALLTSIAAAALLFALNSVGAQVTLYWDGDGVGPVSGGTGTWNTTLTRWSLTPDGTVFQPWVNANNDDAVFANAPGTVSVPAGITARSLDFQVGGYTLSGTGPLTLAGSTVGTINVAAGVTSMGVPVAGTDGFTKTGPGTLVLTANSTAAGNRRILGGALSIDSSLRIPSSGTVTLDGGALIQTNPGSGGSYISAGVALDIGAGGGTVSYTGAAGSSSIYAGTIRGPGTLFKVGTGEFRYQGTGLPNTTFSKLVVKEGLYRLGSASSVADERGFGAVPASFTADAITLDAGAIGTSFGATLHADRGITLGSGGGSINVSAGALTVPSQISDGVGAGPINVVATNATQLLTLSNPANQIASGIIIRGGRLNVTATGASGTGNILFDLGSNAGGLSNNATSLAEINNPLLTLGGIGGTPEIGAATNFTLQINSQVTGTRPFQKTSATGNGTLVLTNSANDFTGGVTVSAGRLVITANNALGSPAGATTINSGATLGLRGGFDYTTAEPITIGGNGATGAGGAIVNFQDDNRFAGSITMTATSTIGVASGALELAGPISGGGLRLFKDGPGTLVLSNPGNSYGSLAIGAGTVAVSSDGNFGAAPAAFVASNIQLAGGALRATSSFAVHPNRGINFVGAGTIDATSGVTLSYPGATVGSTFNKTGGGTVVLSGVNGHAGGTAIHAGTLSLAFTGVLPGDVNIAPGGALHGSGSVGGNVTVAGTIAPGASPGTLTTTGNHTWQGGGAYAWEIDDANGSPGANWDRVTMNAVTISATASNKFTIRVAALPGNGGPGLDNFDPDSPFSWVIATATSGEVNNFDLEAFEIDASQFEQHNENKGGFYVSRSGGDLMLNYVPEPGAVGMLLVSASAALLRRRRSHARLSTNH